MFGNITFLYDTGAEKLPVFFVNCGYELVTDHSYRWDGQNRGAQANYVIWQYTLSGCGAIKYDGREHLLRHGDAFLVAVPDEHIYYLPSSSGRWEFVYITVAGNAAFDVVKEIQSSSGTRVFRTENSSVAGDVIALLDQYRRHELPGYFRTSAMAYNFLMQIAGEIYAEHGRRGHAMLSDRLIAFLQKNVGKKPCSVEYAAAALGFSRTHFTRLFKEETGFSPAEFILDWRLRLAARILTAENCLVKEAAWRAGFCDPSHFGSVFMRKFGCSPDKFRGKKR